MGKKRRVWWFVGALVVLFATIAFLTQLNSLDARVGRAVNRLVDEFGFTKGRNARLRLESGQERQHRSDISSGLKGTNSHTITLEMAARRSDEQSDGLTHNGTSLPFP